MSTDDEMSIEERIRTATRAGASLIQDVRPLGAPQPVRFRRRPAPAPRRWASWGVPLAAAAAVLAVALTLVFVRSAGGPAGSAPVTPAAPSVPRYYVALHHDATGGISAGPMMVGDDVTGQVIDTIAPPRGQDFLTVSGTSDDRTFVVLAGHRATKSAPLSGAWYLLRIAPGTDHPYRLTKLPVALPAAPPRLGLGVPSYALSPDGGELAVESTTIGPGNGMTLVLTIYSVASGAELHTWTGTTSTIAQGMGGVSWLSDGQHLVFTIGQASSDGDRSLQLRTLEVGGPVAGLLTASRAVLTVPASGVVTCESLLPTPDGTTAVCGTQCAYLTNAGPALGGCADGALNITAYPLRPGAPDRVLYAYQTQQSAYDGLASVLWTDPSGAVVIGSTAVNLSIFDASKGTGEVGVISGGHFRPLKIAKQVLPGDLQSLAF